MAGREGREALRCPAICPSGSTGGDNELAGFRRKLMFVFVLLLLESDKGGDVGGGIALLRDRFGDGYDMLSGTE
jgi:hypothetical protein